MDLSPYIDELLEAASLEDQAGNKKPELTHEENAEKFWQLDQNPVFEAIFRGEGPTYLLEGKDLHTWSFTDLNQRNWLLPKLRALDMPLGNFQGFSKEPVNEFIYHIEYKGSVYDSKGQPIHNIPVFRKHV
jgi:hypothetical protein